MTGASILFRLNAFNCNYSSIKIPNENAKICESLILYFISQPYSDEVKNFLV